MEPYATEYRDVLMITQTPALDRVIEALNDEFSGQDDILSDIYDAMINGDSTDEFDDELAVFVVSTAAKIVSEGVGTKTAMRKVSEHLINMAGELRDLAKAIRQD